MVQKNNNIIAHRGAWKEFNLPQNSIASLKKAIELGCAGSEFDVHLSKDAIAVVNHDHDFYGLNIEKHTYKELLKFVHPNREKIPTLNSYLEEGLKQNNTRLILEIKTSDVSLARTFLLIDVIKDLIENQNLENQLEFILFSFDAAIYIKQQLPKYNVSYLNGDKTPQDIKSSGLNGIDYHTDVFSQNMNYFKESKEFKITTNSWTVNQTSDFNKFIDAEIDFITTDYPKQFLEILNNK